MIDRNEGLVLLLKSLHWIKWLRGVPLIKANWFEAHVMWAILCPACTQCMIYATFILGTVDWNQSPHVPCWTQMALQRSSVRILPLLGTKITLSINIGLGLGAAMPKKKKTSKKAARTKSGPNAAGNGKCPEDLTLESNEVSCNGSCHLSGSWGVGASPYVSASTTIY